ncbi:MAG: hypothetical protein GY910_26340 [bacterium]|nr:hypothetical protein [Deltaproteobacteria bacterium]MCP4908509.1 hypothetical protein [bacterium]
MTTRKILTSGLAIITPVMMLALLAGSAQAGNDASIKGDLRTNIHKAMDSFVDQQTVGDKLRIYDAVDGKLLRLGSYELHSGIVKKGDFYVSCADFQDQDGRKIDVDFLVIPNGGELQVTQGIVHSVEGKKRKYHLE